MPPLHFTVDAKLLRELGERLVGRPHMALAELIKNSYDADARTVVIRFDDDAIAVIDDGHGMDRAAFVDRWMRIGTTAKVGQQVSPIWKRRLTGSKGVGRLAVQLLARELQMTSSALVKPDRKLLSRRSTLSEDLLAPEIHASIEWPAALEEDELTDVAVDFHTTRSRRTYAGGSKCGTSITLSGLVDDWGAESFRRLAQEIWALQPPFAVDPDSDEAFNVVLETADDSVAESFDDQMTKIFDIAAARVVGRLLDVGSASPQGAKTFALPAGIDGGLDEVSEADSRPTRKVLLRVKVAGSPQVRFVADIPDCQIEDFDFEIRVFDLQNRQPEGVKVGVARGYLQRFGGVHIYDNGFRLPYYGPELDWLRIELDHARRLSRSALIPDELQLRNAMQDLPTNTRIFGVANISTSAEQDKAELAGRSRSDALSIQVTRDRLVTNKAFDQLQRSVRLGLDLYALEKARSKVRKVARKRKEPRPDPTPALGRASEVVEDLKAEIDSVAYQTLRDSLDVAIDDTTSRREEAQAYAALLGALATAGMTSLAYEHEISKQRAQVQSRARRLRKIAREAPDHIAAQLKVEASELDAWAVRADRIRALFLPLLDEESRTAVARFSAGRLVADVATQMSVLARGTPVDHERVPPGLRLPEGGYAAWSAVIQNLLTNAFRATHARKASLVLIDGGRDGNRAWLRVQDNGDGVDLAEAERLFEPFERAAGADDQADALGLGGSGLGLTIVRMILDELGVTASFVSPEGGMATAVRLEWKEATR